MSGVDLLRDQLAAANADREASKTDWLGNERKKGDLLRALRDLGPAAAKSAPVVLAVLHDEEAYRDTIHYAVTALAAMGREAARVLAADIARTPTWNALDALGKISSEELVGVEVLPAVLAGVLRGDEPALARQAAWVAIRMGCAAEPLVDVLATICSRHTGDDDPRLFDYAIEALVNVGAPGEAALRALMVSERAEVRRRAGVNIAMGGGDRAMVEPALRDAAEHGEGWEREQARELLGLDAEG